MIHILLADDHVIIRTGLKIFITNYISHSVIDEADNGDAALNKVKEKDYQLIILDVNMPGTDSFALVQHILDERPDANILMFTMNSEALYAKKYFQLGVKGYLSKAAPESEMKIALDNVLTGKRYIGPELAELLASEAIHEASGNPFENLSPREYEIAMMLARGLSVSQICNSLQLQSSTVGTFKTRIFQKLHCSNVIEINTLAKVYNLIPG